MAVLFVVFGEEPDLGVAVGVKAAGGDFEVFHWRPWQVLVEGACFGVGGDRGFSAGRATPSQEKKVSDFSRFGPKWQI